MKTFKGFAEIQSAKDLFEKMNYDFERMKKDSTDQYAACDFFLTAFHLLEWFCPGDDKRNERSDLVEKEPLLQIASHIANGFKHFEATNPRHKSIHGIEKQRYVEDDYAVEEYFLDPLVFHLNPDQSKVVGAEELTAIELAERLIHFWRQKLRLEVE